MGERLFSGFLMSTGRRNKLVRSGGNIAAAIGIDSNSMNKH